MSSRLLTWRSVLLVAGWAALGAVGPAAGQGMVGPGAPKITMSPSTQINPYAIAPNIGPIPGGGGTPKIGVPGGNKSNPRAIVAPIDTPAGKSSLQSTSRAPGASDPGAEDWELSGNPQTDFNNCLKKIDRESRDVIAAYLQIVACQRERDREIAKLVERMLQK